MANQTDNQLQNQEALKSNEADPTKQLSALKNEMEAKMHPERVDSRLAQLESKLLTDKEKSEDVSKEEELLKACDENADGVIKGRNEAKCKMQFNIDKEEKEIAADKKEIEADKKEIEESKKRTEESKKRIKKLDEEIEDLKQDILKKVKK